MALMHTPSSDQKLFVPDFTLPGLDGHTYQLKDFKNGHSLVVMFICNHCPYVKAIEDRLIQLGKDLKNMQVHLVAICSNDEVSYPADSFENLKNNWNEKKMGFTYLHDKTQTVAKTFGAVCTPDFFVYNPEGQLSYRGRLDDSWKESEKVTQRELLNAVIELENGRTPQFETPSMGCSIKWIQS